MDIPDAATIVGAAKLTGRTTGGTSIGVLAGLTQAEQGEAERAGIAAQDGDVGALAQRWRLRRGIEEDEAAPGRRAGVGPGPRGVGGQHLFDGAADQAAVAEQVDRHAVADRDRR